MKLKENKIIGKTYSLYSGNDSSECFFDDLSELTNSILNDFKGKQELLEFIRQNSGSKRKLKKDKGEKY